MPQVFGPIYSSAWIGGYSTIFSQWCKTKLEFTCTKSHRLWNYTKGYGPNYFCGHKKG